MNRLALIPVAAQYAVALVAVAVGLLFLLRTDPVIAGLRRWLLVQLGWVRRPGYRRMLKIYGWLLFVLGIALTLMLLLNRPFP